MLHTFQPREDLVGQARTRGRHYQQEAVPLAQLAAFTSGGWNLYKKNKRSCYVRRDTPKPRLLADRVWTLMYRMGFTHLSGADAYDLVLDSRNPASPKQQLDVIAVDDAVGLAIKCESFPTAKKDPDFDSKIASLASVRRSFSDAIRNAVPTANKRHVATVMFTWDHIITDSSRARAQLDNVTLIDETELLYYEELLSHLGPAAKYQFLADVFPRRQIPGLEIRVPALELSMGGHTCYSFAIHPEYLLKIAFVSHRAKGKATDVDAYQRMIKKSRLRKLRDYISEDGMFPTNIVLNIERTEYTRFDRGRQEGGTEGGRFGWLTLSPTYKSAWVIDGQHRLFAYSGHKRSKTDYISVLAFKALGGPEQARMFVDINHEQKSVKRALLDELWAELHWGSDDTSRRVRAVLSKTIQGLADAKDSPLCGRVLFADCAKTEFACISLTSMMSALDKDGMYVEQSRRGDERHGPLWAGTNDQMVRRTMACLKAWFNLIAASASDWWNCGSGEGGGLAMNDGVTVCLNVLRSVFEHLAKTHDLAQLEDKELIELISPYGQILGEYFASFNNQQRATFRAFRGVQGQTSCTREAQIAIRSKRPDFDPPGLGDYIVRAKSGYNDKARDVINRIEQMLQDTVLSILKEEFKASADDWWYSGVPQSVRKVVAEKIEENDGKAGEREKNFDLIHYRQIIVKNWEMFEDLVAIGDSGNKDKKTSWIAEVNLMRNKVSHASRREYLSAGDVERLRQIEDIIKKQVNSNAS